MVQEYSIPVYYPGQKDPEGVKRGRPKSPTSVTLGTGLSIWSGQVQEEYLAQLKPWSKAVKVYQEMYDDSVIGAMYEAIKAPLLDASFRVIGGTTKADQDAIDFIRKNTYDSVFFSWSEHVEDMLDFLPFGFSLAEKVLIQGAGGYLYLRDLMPVAPETLYKWGRLQPNGRVDGFYQFIPNNSWRELRNMAQGGSPIQYARMSKLVHMTFRARKRNPLGNSMSKSLYRPWYYKRNLEALEAIGAERDVGNVPVVELGEGSFTEQDTNDLKSALRGLRMDETAYLIVPNGAQVRPFGAGGKVYNIREIIRDYGHLIRQRFFVDFIALGAEQVGTQALAKEISGFFSLALGSIQRYMLEAWNHQLIPYLIGYNGNKFSGISEMPKLVWAKPGKLNAQAVAQSVAQLLGSQAIHYNFELEEYLRQTFELPPISEREIRQQERREAMMQGLTHQGEQVQPGSKPANSGGKEVPGNTESRSSSKSGKDTG